MWGHRPASCHVHRQLEVLFAKYVGTYLMYDLVFDLDKNLDYVCEKFLGSLGDLY